MDTKTLEITEETLPRIKDEIEAKVERLAAHLHAQYNVRLVTIDVNWQEVVVGGLSSYITGEADATIIV